MEDLDNQKYSLKWNNFESIFMSQFEALKDDEDFVDVTLSCYGQSIKAHKVVLSACSPYLKSILKEHPCKHPIIILDSLSFSNLEALIQFIYTGQVHVEQTELPSFLKAAESLQIRGLTESSDNKYLWETNLPQVPETDSLSSLPTKKRGNECDSGIKKFSNKKIVTKNSFNREDNEIKLQKKEKDWLNNYENKAEDNFEIPNEYNESEQSMEVECKNFSKDEDCILEEQRKPHWSDPRSCPLCNRTYSNSSNLKQHMKLIHNPTLVTCKLCCKTFKTALYLRRHLISFHEMGGNGNNNIVSMDCKTRLNQPPPTSSWNLNIKSVTNGFREMLNGGESYQVPE